MKTLSSDTLPKEKSHQPAPRGDRRMLYVSDPSSIATHYLPNPVQEDDLRRLISMMARSGVDMYCQDVYSQCWTAYWRSENFPYDQRSQHQRFLPMLDAGIQPVQVLLDECHNKQMLFIAGFRVNDGHGYHGLSKATGIKVAIEEAIKANPQWELKDLSDEDQRDSAGSYHLDFSCDGVRDYTLAVINEMIEDFDVDGVELCFRDAAYFPAGKGPERAGLMTDIFRQVRAALDEKSQAAGKKLLFGARVCSSIEELLELGLDVRTWVNEGLLDYISPQDILWIDFDFPFEEFRALTANSKCLLYPGLLPWTSQRMRIQFQARPVNFDTARAFAYSCYQNGADGISPFNHCTVTRVTPFYPQSLQVFHELRDPEKVAASARHYAFDSFLSGFYPYFDQEGKPTGITKTDKIFLDRAVDKPTGEYELSIYEDTEDVHSVSLLFRGFCLTHEDELEIRFNGHVIDNDLVGRTKLAAALPPQQEAEAPTAQPDIGVLLSRSMNKSDHRKYKGRLFACMPELGRFSNPLDPRTKDIPPHSTVWFPLDPAVLVYGKNCLSVTLTRSDPNTSLPIAIEEVEIFVMPK